MKTLKMTVEFPTGTTIMNAIEAAIGLLDQTPKVEFLFNDTPMIITENDIGKYMEYYRDYRLNKSN